MVLSGFFFYVRCRPNCSRTGALSSAISVSLLFFRLSVLSNCNNYKSAAPLAPNPTPAARAGEKGHARVVGRPRGSQRRIDPRSSSSSSLWFSATKLRVGRRRARAGRSSFLPLRLSPFDMTGPRHSRRRGFSRLAPQQRACLFSQNPVAAPSWVRARRGPSSLALSIFFSHTAIQQKEET